MTMPRTFLEWAALIMGAWMIFGGVRAVRRQRAEVPELIEGRKAANLGWLWIVMGVLFVLAAFFDVPFLKTIFKAFLEAAN
jgi:hypothetical protein